MDVSREVLHSQADAAGWRKTMAKPLVLRLAGANAPWMRQGPSGANLGMSWQSLPVKRSDIFCRCRALAPRSAHH